MDEAIMTDTTTEPKPVVLVALDDRDLSEIIATFLEAKGWFVVSVPSRPGAIDNVRKKSDVLITAAVIDVRSFASASFRLLERLCAENPRWPIIVIASFGDAFVANRARHLGAACVLEKPFDLEDLERALVG
jgi:FixJ family two-component response regulator